MRLVFEGNPTRASENLLVGYLQIQLATQGTVEVCEKLCFEGAVDKRIRFLWATNKNREPVILEVGAADTLDGTDCDCSL